MLQECSSSFDGRKVEEEDHLHQQYAGGVYDGVNETNDGSPPPCRGGSDELGDNAIAVVSSSNHYGDLMDFFQTYDTYQTVASSLQTDYDALLGAKQNQLVLEEEIKWTKSSLHLNKQFIQEQKERIELIGNHWFYGQTIFQPQLWFRGGCQGKKDRARFKLLRAVQDQPNLETKATQLESKVLTATESLRQHEIAYQRSFTANQQLQQMREGLVQQYSTDALQQLQRQEAEIQQQIQQHQQQTKTTLQTLESQLESANRCSSNVKIKTNSAFKKIQISDELTRQQPICCVSLPAQAAKNDYKTTTECVRTEVIPTEDGGHETYRRSRMLQQLESPDDDDYDFNNEEYVDYKQFDAKGNLILSNNPCPNGCGYVVTWHGKYCCSVCESEASSSSTATNNSSSAEQQHHHGCKCDRIPLSSQDGSQDLYELLLKQRQQHADKINSTIQDAKEDLQCALSELKNGYFLLHKARETATSTMASTTSSAAPPPVFPQLDSTQPPPPPPHIDTINDEDKVGGDDPTSSSDLKSIINYLRVQNHEFETLLDKAEGGYDNNGGGGGILHPTKQWMEKVMVSLQQQLDTIRQQICHQKNTIFDSLRPGPRHIVATLASSSNQPHHYYHHHPTTGFNPNPHPFNSDVRPTPPPPATTLTPPPITTTTMAATTSSLGSFEHISMLSVPPPATTTTTTTTRADVDDDDATAPPPPLRTSVEAAATESPAGSTMTLGSGCCMPSNGGGGGASNALIEEQQQNDTLSTLPNAAAITTATTTATSTTVMSSFEVVGEEDSISAYVVLTNEV